MSDDALKLARDALADNWAPNMRCVARELAAAVIAQQEEIERLRASVANLQRLEQRIDAEQATLRAALSEALDYAHAGDEHGLVDPDDVARIAELRRLIP